MSAQAGWYESPGEPGMLRYWGGEAWTDHRQPTPTSAPVAAATPVSAPSAVLTPTIAPTAVLTPSSVLDPYAQDNLRSTSQGTDLWQSGTQAHSGFLQDHVGIGLNVDGIPVGPGALAQLSELSDVASVMQIKMREAQANARVQPRSTAVKGALSGMVVGIVMILLGAALILFFSGQQNPQDGESQTQGTVTGHDGFGSSCEPDVGYTVAGKRYTVSRDIIGGSCAQDTLGDSANVIYSIADPSNARADFGNPLGFVDIGLPFLGVVVFFSSLAALVSRLARRRRQVATP